nr:MAG TPA: putative cytoplasmic protein [Caudoviricetes sp.]
MISDKERREIAESLRKSREFISGLPNVSLGEKAFATLDRILACVGYERGNIFDYLADFIDRPTCRNEDGYGRSFFCSACGYEAWTYDDSCCDPKDFSFCPNCGAKVVDDD